MEAERDCACITHEGPHWLHMDYITKRQNIERLLCVALNAYQCGDYHNGARYMQEYARAEKQRMDEKLRYMKEGEQYPYSLLGDVQDLQALAVSIHQQIGEAIEEANAKYSGAVEVKQEAMF